MGNTTDLSPRKIGTVKVLLEDGQDTQTQIAKRLNISQTSVSRIKQAANNHETYEQNRVGKCGRKRILKRFSN